MKSAFIPEYEFPGVSAALDGVDRYFFSTFTMSVKSKKEETMTECNFQDFINPKNPDIIKALKNPCYNINVSYDYTSSSV